VPAAHARFGRASIRGVPAVQPCVDTFASACTHSAHIFPGVYRGGSTDRLPGDDGPGWRNEGSSWRVMIHRPRTARFNYSLFREPWAAPHCHREHQDGHTLALSSSARGCWMNAALRRTTRTSCWIMTAALVAALALAGCATTTTRITRDVSELPGHDYGNGEQYKLCCTVTCNYH